MENKAHPSYREQSQKKTEIDILPLFRALLNKIWLIILAAVIVGVGSFVVSKLTVKPTYRSGFSAYVNNTQAQSSKEYLSNSDILAAHELVLTYSSILTSNTVLTAAADSLNMDLSYQELSPMVTTTVQQDTEIIYVHVVSESKDLSYDLANALAKVSPSYMANIIDGSSMKIIDYPVYPQGRYKPSYFRYGIIGALVGALLMALFVIIRYFSDDTIKSEADLEKMFSLPVVGLIPDVDEVHKDGSSYYSYSYGKSGKAEKEGEKNNG